MQSGKKKVFLLLSNRFSSETSNYTMCVHFVRSRWKPKRRLIHSRLRLTVIAVVWLVGRVCVALIVALEREGNRETRVRFKERLVHESWMSRCPQTATLVLKQTCSPHVSSIPNHLLLCWRTRRSKLIECPERSRSRETRVGEVRFSYVKPGGITSGQESHFLAGTLLIPHRSDHFSCPSYQTYS